MPRIQEEGHMDFTATISGRADLPHRARAASRGAFGALGALALSLALAVGCATAPHPPPGPQSERFEYRLGPPDELVLTIFPEPVIERELVVRPDGMITVDLIGDVKAGGRTPEDVAEEIEERISRFKRDPEVTIAVRASRSTQITVLGEVGRPATFPLERRTRVAEAIGKVGGPTVFAAESRIRVIRFDGEKTHVFLVDLEAIQEGDLASNLTLQEGDLVVVPPTRWASVGKAMQVALFPFQQLFGFGASVTTRVFTGGAL